MKNIKSNNITEKRRSKTIIPIEWVLDDLEIISSANNYKKIQQDKLNEMLAQFCVTQSIKQQNLRNIMDSAKMSINIFIFLKHLYLIHMIIKNVKDTKSFFQQNLLRLSFENLRKLCKSHNFDEWIFNNLVEPYINYIKKICASNDCMHLSLNKEQELESKIFVFGILNLIKFGLNIIPFLNKHSEFFGELYPFIKDIESQIMIDVKCMYYKIKYVLQDCKKTDNQEIEQEIIQFIREEFLIIQRSILEIFRTIRTINKYENLRTEERVLTQINSYSIKRFLDSSGGRINKLSTIHHRQSLGKENIMTNNNNINSQKKVSDFQQTIQNTIKEKIEQFQND